MKNTLDQMNISDHFKQMKENIQNYRKNVIEAKYENNLQELESLLNGVHYAMDGYVRDHQREMTPEKMKFVLEDDLDYQYIMQIYFELKKIIENDKNLNKYDSAVLLAQNHYIKNMTLRDEVQRRMNYIEKVSLKSRKEYQNKTREEFEERFAVVENAEGRKKYILKEYAKDYQDMAKMKGNIITLLSKDLKEIQSIYNRQLEQMEGINLGEIKTSQVDPSFFLLSDDQIQKRASEILNRAQKMSSLQGMKEKYQFIFEGKEYTVMIPCGKKAYFLNSLQELAGLRDVLQNRALPPQNELEEDVIYEEFVDIKIDYSMFEQMTFQQRASYLQSIMLRIENVSSVHLYSVTDANGNEKKIPAYYAKVYEECKSILRELAIVIDESYVSTLSEEEKISYYEKIIQRILNAKNENVTMVNGEKVPIMYYRTYIKAQKELHRLNTQKRVEASEFEALPDKTVTREYMIDEDYVKGLSQKQQLSYYANIIGKCASCKMTPVVVYESFGMKLEVPISLVTTVQEAERRALELKEKLSYQIDPSVVATKTPAQAYSYYFDLIEKMEHSKKVPKVSVEFLDRSIEIPEECLASYQECMSKIKELEYIINSFTPMTTRLKVKKCRKPLTQKVKDFVKKHANRVKLALGAAALAATSFSFGFAMGSQKNVEVVDAPQVTDISALFAQDENEAVMESEESYEEANERIDAWAEAATQTAVSQFGTTLTLDENVLINENPYDMNHPKNLYSGFKNSLFTTTNITVKMPDQTIRDISFMNENAQNEVNALIADGGVIQSVGVVAQEAEDHYLQNGFVTGYVTLDQIHLDTRTTNLSEQIKDALSQGRSL